MSAVVPLLRQQPEGVSSRDLEARLAALETMLDELLPRRLPVRDGARIVLVDRDSIEWIESAGNYVVIHSAGRTLVARETLEYLQLELGTRFLRVRRDVLVNSSAVRELHPLFRGEFRLALRDGSHVQSTRRFRRALDPLIGAGPR